MGTEAGDGTTFNYAGGVGSISYTLSEIAESGTVVAALARRMEPLVDSLHSEWLWLRDAAADSPLDALAHALWISKRAQTGATTLAQQLSAAAENYAATEARTAAATTQAGRFATLQDGLDAWGWGPLAPLKMAVDLAGWLNRAKDGGLRAAAENVLNNGVAYGAGALGPGMGMAYLLSQLRNQGRIDSSGVQPALAVRTLVDAAGLARPGHLVVRRVPAQEWKPATVLRPSRHGVPAAEAESAGDPWPVEASIAGMVAGSRDSYAYPPGSIGVVRVVRPGGTPAWIVHLPGTEDWSTIDSSNPFDMEGNLEGLTAAYKDSYRQQHVLVQELIKGALHASGALPTDDVMLTGHSGGGIHAAAAAADPEFLAEVNVKMIVIAGAPAKNLDVGENISVLDLQNEDDVVTALDFGPPPATRDWVTVTSHRSPTATGADLGTTVKEAHAVENYLKDAVALEASSNAAVLAQRQALAAFVGVGVGATAQGTKFVFQGRDVDAAAGKKPGRKRPGNHPSAAGGVPAQSSGNQ